jgi:hypothetical protein
MAAPCKDTHCICRWRIFQGGLSVKMDTPPCTIRQALCVRGHPACICTVYRRPSLYDTPDAQCVSHREGSVYPHPSLQDTHAIYTVGAYLTGRAVAVQHIGDLKEIAMQVSHVSHMSHVVSYTRTPPPARHIAYWYTYVRPPPTAM